MLATAPVPALYRSLLFSTGAAIAAAADEGVFFRLSDLAQLRDSS